MERGVYLMEFGDLMELTAIDHQGRPIRRLLVRKELYVQADLAGFWEWLDRVSPQPSCALRLV